MPSSSRIEAARRISDRASSNSPRHRATDREPEEGVRLDGRRRFGAGQRSLGPLDVLRDRLRSLVAVRERLDERELGGDDARARETVARTGEHPLAVAVPSDVGEQSGHPQPGLTLRERIPEPGGLLRDPLRRLGDLTQQHVLRVTHHPEVETTELESELERTIAEPASELESFIGQLLDGTVLAQLPEGTRQIDREVRSERIIVRHQRDRAAQKVLGRGHVGAREGTPSCLAEMMCGVPGQGRRCVGSPRRARAR